MYCFFSVNDSMSFVILYFTGNNASEGSGICGGGIQYWEVEVRNQRQSSYKILQNLTNLSSEIQNEYANHEPSEISICNGSIKVQRGQAFNISVTVMG